MSHDSLAQKVRRELGVGTNPLYIESILAMDDARFIEWCSKNLENMSTRTLPEFASHLMGDEGSRQGVCRLGVEILTGDLRRLTFILEERYGRKFEAIDIAP